MVAHSKHKTEVVLEAVRRRCINVLILDLDLAESMAKRLKAIRTGKARGKRAAGA